jgi:ATP-dependent Clp protease ATP-binding subunit ClpA
MFEKFTREARTVVAGAQDEARALRNPQIGTEHLLLAMLAHDDLAGRLLGEYGVTADAVRDRLQSPDASLDPDALAVLGIDLGEVRRAAEEQFGPGALAAKAVPMPPGHIPFSKGGKKVLELALREAVALRSDSINSGHLLLGLIREDAGRGAQLIRDACVDLEALQAEARVRAGRPAA